MNVRVPPFRYSNYRHEPIIEVHVATGWETEPDELTPDQCRLLADWLRQAADEAEAQAVGLDRMTNSSDLRHRTPHRPRPLTPMELILQETVVCLREAVSRTSWAGPERRTKVRRS